MLTYKGQDIKACLVAHGFEEDVDTRVDSPTVGKCSVRLCIGIAASNNWYIKSTDIKSAFLQSNHLDRDVFILPQKEASVSNKVWKLNKCLYK